ncbi:hypothetical protein [Streptomyces vinaceus]|uniref:hypothetical protein n=1 Tax=Streptomyces vinaceus TaxID=1960 RepID=UPI0036BF4882
MFVMRRRLWSSALPAVLAVVLAALVHILACAHGPELGRAASSDSLPVSAEAAIADGRPLPAPADTAGTGEERDMRFADCAGADEPGVPSRELSAPPEPDAVASVRAVPRQPVATAGHAGQSRGSPGHHEEQQRVRSVLGVWRT